MSDDKNTEIKEEVQAEVKAETVPKKEAGDKPVNDLQPLVADLKAKGLSF